MSAWAYCDECVEYRAVSRVYLGEQSWNFQELCAPCARHHAPQSDASGEYGDTA